MRANEADDRDAVAVEIGNRLRAARTRKGLDAQEAAISVGYHPVSLSKAETGKALPRASTLKALAALYGVRVGWLYGEDSESSAAAHIEQSSTFSPGECAELSRALRQIADILDRGK